MCVSWHFCRPVLQKAQESLTSFVSDEGEEAGAVGVMLDALDHAGDAVNVAAVVVDHPHNALLAAAPPAHLQGEGKRTDE